MPLKLKRLRKQRTIADRAVVNGFGYWSGKDVEVEFRPASHGSGLTFHLKTEGAVFAVPANFKHRIDVPRRTNLSFGTACVAMVEHVLATLSGLGVDNCDIVCSSSEMPGCDGSSLAFTEALNKVGFIEQPADRMGLVIRHPVRVGSGDSWVEARPIAERDGSQHASLHYRLDYGENSVIPAQEFRVTINPKNFQQELASARTFVLQQEADALQAEGKGLRVTTSDLIVFNNHGPIDTTLRFPNECARHKVLDMVGDFALAGVDLIGEFEAYRAGHRLNVRLIEEVFAAHCVSEEVLQCA